MGAILVSGMHGLGDSLHQRAVLRQLMQSNEVWLESSWVAPYHDLISEGLHVVRKNTTLRTQAGNAHRERDRFEDRRMPITYRTIDIWYKPAEVRAAGSVLGAMCRNTGTDIETADFRLTVPKEWQDRAREFIGYPAKPVMVYRPLVERMEWSGCSTRNPDHNAYQALFESIRDRFHVVSVADLVPGKEWTIGPLSDADQYFHGGQLEFESLAGLFSLASLVFCSPGFAVILAQAVGTPVATIFGGYERAYSFSAGARYSPYLGIEPNNPCDCFKHGCRCSKSIDVPAARERLEAFASAAAQGCAIAAGRSADRLAGLASHLHGQRRT